MSERPSDIPEPYWAVHLQGFASCSVHWKLELLRRISHDGGNLAVASYLAQFLDDDAPYVFDLRGTPLIAEVRSRVLETVEQLYRLLEEPPAVGAVKVRMPMPATEAIAKAQSALERSEEREKLLTDADASLARSHPNLQPEEREALRSYRVLQALGQIEYRLEHVDPETYLTPLQQEIVDGQTRSPRPRPHLRFPRRGKPEQTLGWLYRDQQGLWAIDFSEAFDAREVERDVERALGAPPRAVFSIMPSTPRMWDPKVRRVRRDADGEPMRDADGFLLYDGFIPLDTPDTVELLQNVQVLLEDEEPELLL